MIPAKPRVEDLKLTPLQEAGIVIREPDVSWIPSEEFTDRAKWLIRDIRRPSKNDERPDKLRATVTLVDTGQEQRAIRAYNIRERRFPHAVQLGPGHFILSSFGPQELDQFDLAAGILCLRELAKHAESYSGFINVVAPSHSGFHFQYVSERLPIWQAVNHDNAMPILGGRGRIANVDDWPFSAICFESQDCTILVEAVWNYIEDLKKEYDILLNCEEEKFQCIPVRRRSRKPVSFCATKWEDYGNFGAMELSGIIVTVRDPDMIRALKDEKKCGSLKSRVDASFREVCYDERVSTSLRT